MLFLSYFIFLSQRKAMRYWFSHSFSSAFIWVQGGQPTKQGQQIRMLLKVARQTDLGCFPLGNKINKWSQREDKFSSVYGTVLHAEYKGISFTEMDWALKKVFSIVGWWASGSGSGRSAMGHQAHQQQPRGFRNPVGESSQIAPHQLNVMYMSFSLPVHRLQSHQSPPWLGYLF